MRILIITGIFHPEPGGPATYLQALLPRLQARGHAVRVITYGEAEDAGTDYGYPVQRITRRQSIPRRLAQFSWAVLRQARAADVLYVQGYAYPALLAHLLLRRPLVTKTVSDFAWEFARRHGWTALDVTAFQKARHPLRVRLLRALQAWTLRRSAAVIVPSGHIGRLVQGWGVPAERVQVVTNAVPRSPLAEADRATLRAELGLPLETPLLVTVGRLTPVKGVDVAIRALEYLPDALLVIVGEGEQRAELETLAAPYGSRVRFVGQQPNQRALRFVRAADSFVLSSYTEGLSHVLLEALTVGTPVVATAVGGNPEILTDGVNGLLVPPGDPRALAAAIGRLLADPALAERLAAAGRARGADFDWEHTMAQTEAILARAARRQD